MRAGRVAIAALGAATLSISVPLGIASRTPGGAAPAVPLVAGTTIVQDDAALLHRSPSAIRASVRELARMGVGTVRVTAGWSVLAPSPAARRRPRFRATQPRAYQRVAWAKLDRLARLVHAQGMSLMIDIAFFAPRWAVAHDSRQGDRQRDGIDPRAYADFAEAVARRYSGSYHGLPAAGAFTIWNEPNFHTFLLPQWRRGAHGWEVASADEYRALLYAAVPRIRTAAPQAKVLIGATAATGAEHPRERDDPVAPLAFARALACVDEHLAPITTGTCAHFKPLPGDGWSHHPYSLGLAPEAPSPLRDDVRMGDLPRLVGLLGALHRAGRTQAPLGVWITEYGFQTSPPDPTAPVTPREQADYLARAERVAVSTPGVRSFAQFLLVDLPARPGPARRRWSDYQSGLRYADGRPKPALASFRTPFVVGVSAAGTTTVWARLRRDGERDVRLLRRKEGSWIAIEGLAPVLRTRPDGVLAIDTGLRRGTAVRLDERAGGRWVTRACAPRCR